jgi:hypothetical protein
MGLTLSKLVRTSMLPAGPAAGGSRDCRAKRLRAAHRRGDQRGACRRDASRGGEHWAGGEGGIRTLGGLAPTPVFETGLFSHSSTSPERAPFWGGRAFSASAGPDQLEGRTWGPGISGVRRIAGVIVHPQRSPRPVPIPLTTRPACLYTPGSRPGELRPGALMFWRFRCSR